MMMRIALLLCSLTFAQCSSQRSAVRGTSVESGLSGIDGDSRRLQTATLRGFKSVTKEAMQIDYPSAPKKGSKKGSEGGDYSIKNSKKGKGGKGGKKDKRSKSQKKTISKKLKKSKYSEEYPDEYDYPYPAVTYPPSDDDDLEDEVSSTPVDLEGEASSTPADFNSFSSSPVAVEAQTPPPSMSPSQTASQSDNGLRVGPPVENPTEALASSNVAPARQSNSDTQKTRGELLTKRTSYETQISPFIGPTVLRNIYPAPVQLKAHSSIALSDKEKEIFTVLQSRLTPYLQAVAAPSLRAYTLEVAYTPGEDATDYGVVITEMEITCILSVESHSRATLNLTHEEVDEWIHHFFTGTELNEFLVELRKNVKVNEIVTLDEEFRSPIFESSVAGVVSTTKSKNSQPADETKSSAGMVTAISMGLLVVCAVLYAHSKGRVPIEELTQSVRGAFSSDSDSQSDIVEKEVVQTRTRTWSGSFRRFPTGGVRPAAIQKSPAYSKEYLNKMASREAPVTKPTFDDQSFSVAGDYNIPAEYDFKASPMSDVYSPKGGKHNVQEDEFSMPEDYSTVNEEFSLYSKSVRPNIKRLPKVAERRRGGNACDDPLTSPSPRGISSSNPFGSPLSRGSGSDASPFRIADGTPTSEQYLDEWSVDSYGSPTSPSSDPPYRHWGQSGTSPNRRSQLEMPPLS